MIQTDTAKLCEHLKLRFDLSLQINSWESYVWLWQSCNLIGMPFPWPKLLSIFTRPLSSREVGSGNKTSHMSMYTIRLAPLLHMWPPSDSTLTWGHCAQFSSDYSILHCSKIVLIILAYVAYYCQFMLQRLCSKSWELPPWTYDTVAIKTTRSCVNFVPLYATKQVVLVKTMHSWYYCTVVAGWSALQAFLEV